MKFLCCCLPVLIVCLDSSAEELLLIEAETVASPLLVYRDKAASKGKCIAIDVSPISGTFLNVELPNELDPGLYRAGFFMRISTRREPLSKGLNIRVGLESGQRGLTYLNLDDAAEFQRFDLLFEMKDRDVPALSIGWKHDAEVHKEALGVTVAKQKAEDLVPNLLEEEELDEGDGEEELAILRDGKPLSEAGRIYIALDRILIEPVTRIGAIQKIWTEKIHYEPGSDTYVDITVQNYQGVPIEGELELEMLYELDGRKEIGRRNIHVEAGGQTTTRFEFNAGKEEFGRELKATLLVNGKPVHSANEYFGVSEQVWKIGISGWGWPLSSFGMKKRVDFLVQKNRENYANFYEQFAWAPSDYCDMTPDTEEFWSGQSQYHGTITDCKAVIDTLHKHGIKAITYGKACGGGLPGYETLRKHKEWYHAYGSGIGIEGGPEVDFIDRMRSLDFSLGAPDGWQSWQGPWLNSRVKEAVVFGAEEILRSTDLLDWDGIRWDGHFSVGGDDGDEITAANTKLVKEIIWKKYPKFLHGYNCLLAQYSDKRPVVNPYPIHPALKDFEECCRDGGLIMNESLRDFSNRNFSHRIMEVFGEAMALEGDWVRQLGGYYLAIGFDRATNLDSLYNHIFFTATGARPYGQVDGRTSIGHFWKFATRYSCLVYDNRRVRLAAPEEVITVKTSHPTWWKAYTYYRPLSGNRAQLHVHLIGQPEEKRFNELRQPPPPVQKNVKVKFKLPSGWKSGNGYQVSIEIGSYKRNLKPLRSGGEVTLTLPDFRYWSIVVLEIERGEGATAFKFTDPVKAAREGDQKNRKAAEKAKLAKLKLQTEMLKPPSEKPTTDSDRLAKSKIQKIEEPRLRRNGIPDILMAKNVYHWMYELEEAIGWAGGAVVADAKVNLKGGWFRSASSSMPDLPRSFEEIAGYDVIVLNNVAAMLMNLQQRYTIERFVEAGGGLLIIGGEWSIDRGGFQNTFLGDLVPVEMKPPITTTAIYKEGLPLKSNGNLRLRDKVNWDAAPQIFCMHDVQPIPGTKVLLKAGDLPLIVQGDYGQGKVVVFTGSTMGIVPQGKLAFWYWDGMPIIFGRIFEILSEGSAEVTKTAPPDVDRDQVLESLINLTDLMPKEQMNVILKLCAICDKEVAEGLVGILGADSQLPLESYELIVETVRPFIDKSFKSDAMDAANSEIIEARAAGTACLGLAAGEEARELILERLADMDLKAQRAAAVALGDLHDPQNVKPLDEKRKEIRKMTSANDEGTSELAGLEHDLIVALYRSRHKPALALLIRANENAAGQFVRFERRREALLEQAGTAFKLTPKESRIWRLKIRRCGQRKAWWFGECRRLSAELQNIPDDWLEVVFLKALTVNEPASVSLMCEVLGHLDPKKHTASFIPVVTARNTILRMLALERVMNSGTETDRSRAAANLFGMSSSDQHFDRLYALRRMRLFTADQRVDVLSRLLKDIQPEVRISARAMLYLVEDAGERKELSRIRSVYDRNVVLD